MRLRRQTRRAPEDPVREPFTDAQMLAAFRLLKAGIQGRKGETAVASLLAANGLEALHDVILPDETGLTQIDHLVLGADAVIVLETKNYAGRITGDPRAMEWWQLLRDGSVCTPFQNPLRQNFRHREAVRRLIEQAGLEVPVRSYVVSAGTAEFVPELEPLVVGLTRLPGLCSKTHRDAPIEPRLLAEAWWLLERTATAHECRRQEHWASLASRKA